MGKLVVFTATYDEAQNVDAWLDGVREAAPLGEMLVVDDNSPDGTGQILDSRAEAGMPLTVIHRSRKSGLASAHLQAMLWTLDNGFDYLVTMDADGSHLTSQIPRLLDALPGQDFVIGTRYRGGSHRASGLRRGLSAGANGMARILLPTGLSEYTTSFRAFNRRSLQVLVDSQFVGRGYAFFFECVELLYQADMRMTEVPIDFVDRAHGSSKIPKSQVVMSALTLSSMGVRRRLGSRSITSR